MIIITIVLFDLWDCTAELLQHFAIDYLFVLCGVFRIMFVLLYLSASTCNRHGMQLACIKQAFCLSMKVYFFPRGPITGTLVMHRCMYICGTDCDESSERYLCDWYVIRVRMPLLHIRTGSSSPVWSVTRPSLSSLNYINSLISMHSALHQFLFA